MGRRKRKNATLPMSKYEKRAQCPRSKAFPAFKLVYIEHVWYTVHKVRAEKIEGCVSDI